MHCGLGGCGLSIRKRALPWQTHSHRVSTWIPTNCDWRHATVILEFINTGSPSRDENTWSGLDCDDGMVAIYPVATPYQRNDTDRYPGAFTAIKMGTLNRFIPIDYLLRSTEDPAPQTIDRIQSTGERENALAIGHGLRFCHLPSPPSTPRDVSRRSTMPHADAKSDATPDGLVILPASPTSSQLDGAWQDETYAISMAQICSTVRTRGALPRALLKHYKRYAEVVAVNALFPTDVPLSLGEICVYYPYHLRWQDVMLRLVENDYRGQDILGIQVGNWVT